MADRRVVAICASQEDCRVIAGLFCQLCLCLSRSFAFPVYHAIQASLRCDSSKMQCLSMTVLRAAAAGCSRSGYHCSAS